MMLSASSGAGPASRYLFDLDPESFPAMVLGNSHEGLVVVFWWSPWSVPCDVLLPRLVRIADEHHGRFLLGLVNTDMHGDFARAQQIRGIPAVTLYRHGRAVQTVYGAWSLKEYRTLIAGHLAGEHGSDYHAALSAFREGMAEQALELLDHEADHGDWRSRIDQIRRLLEERRFAEALDGIERLDRALPDIDEARHLSAHLRIIAMAGSAGAEPALRERLAADPTDGHGRYALAALCLVTDRDDEAWELLESLREDPAAGADWQRLAAAALAAVTTTAAAIPA